MFSESASMELLSSSVRFVKPLLNGEASPLSEGFGHTKLRLGLNYIEQDEPSRP